MRFNDDATARLDVQAGVISRGQLRACGYAGPQIDSMLRHRHLERLDHGIYRRTGSGHAPQQEEVAAVLRCGPGARLTGARLLGHLGVEGFSTFDRFLVLVAAGRSMQRLRLPVRRDHRPGLHRAVYGPVHGTTPARTLAELAVGATYGDQELLSIYDRMRWRGVVSEQRLTSVVADLGRHRGAVRLRRLLRTTSAILESPGERSLEVALGPLEPQLEWQAWLAPDLRVDGVWRDVALVVEYQGGGSHEHGRDRERDRQRHARLRAMGYEVVVVDRHDLREPEALRARLTAARRSRRAELLQYAEGQHPDPRHVARTEAPR